MFQGISGTRHREPWCKHYGTMMSLGVVLARHRSIAFERDLYLAHSMTPPKSPGYSADCHSRLMIL